LTLDLKKDEQVKRRLVKITPLEKGKGGEGGGEEVREGERWQLVVGTNRVGMKGSAGFGMWGRLDKVKG